MPLNYLLKGQFHSNFNPPYVNGEILIPIRDNQFKILHSIKSLEATIIYRGDFRKGQAFKIQLSSVNRRKSGLVRVADYDNLFTGKLGLESTQVLDISVSPTVTAEVSGEYGTLHPRDHGYFKVRMMAVSKDNTNIPFHAGNLCSIL